MECTRHIYFIVPRIWSATNPVTQYPFANSPNKIHPTKCLQVALVSSYTHGIENQAYHFSALADLDRTNWAFCPSTPPAIVFTVLFALTTVAHLSQAIFYKKAYCWVIFGSGFVQTVNYVCRVISIKNPNILGPYAAWFILMLASYYYAAKEVNC